MVDFVIKQHDDAPDLEQVLVDWQKNPVNLTGIAAVRFLMRPRGSVTPKIDSFGSVVGPPMEGRVSYSWSSADTDTAGVFYAEWEVIFASGATETYPNPGFFTVQVTPDIASHPMNVIDGGTSDESATVIFQGGVPFVSELDGGDSASVPAYTLDGGTS